MEVLLSNISILLYRQAAVLINILLKVSLLCPTCYSIVTVNHVYSDHHWDQKHGLTLIERQSLYGGLINGISIIGTQWCSYRGDLCMQVMFKAGFTVEHFEKMTRQIVLFLFYSHVLSAWVYILQRSVLIVKHLLVVQLICDYQL